MFEAYTPSEVALRLPVEVTCLGYQGTSQSVLAGGKAGHLYVYAASANRRGFELINFCKNFERKAVLELSICEAEDILLCIADGQLVAHRLSDTHYTVETLLHKVKHVSTFAKFTPKGSGQLYVIVASRKKFHLFKWGEKEGHREFLEISFDYDRVFVDTPSCIRCIDKTVFFAVRDEYFMMNMKSETIIDEVTNEEKEIWDGIVVQLLNFQSQPGIIPMIDMNRIAFVRNENVVTTDMSGKKQHEEFKFSEIPLQIVYDSPYLVAMLSKGRVEIRSSFDGKLIQTMSLNKAITICNGQQGQVFIASISDIWILDTATHLRRNVSLLLQERYFEMAVQLVDSSNAFSEESKLEIKRQAAFNLFNQKKFDESFTLFREIRTEVTTVLKLFPEFLPDEMKKEENVSDLAANDKKRALIAFGNYLSAIRTEYAQQIKAHNREKASGGVKKSEVEETARLLRTLRVVDTTLLKCYIETRPSLVDSLIRLPTNACSFDDAEMILKNSGKIRSLFILYESRKKHEMALDLLIDQSTREDADAFFEDAVEMIVEYLQSLGKANISLILKYTKWVLNKDLTSGLRVLTSDETEMARNLDRRAVVNFMKTECAMALIPYLEHVIYKWEESEAIFHETLLEYYVAKVNGLFKDYVHAFPDDENINRAGEEEGELGVFRKKLLKFLEFSNVYSPQTILLQLAPHAFYEERALILGRLKQHEQALSIYVHVLKNIDAAEEYCNIYYSPIDETNSQIYLLLFRALVAPSTLCKSSEDLVGSPFGSYCNEEQEEEEVEDGMIRNVADVNAAIRILSKHADKIDTVSALEMLPPQTPLRIVSSAINAVLLAINQQANKSNLQKCVSECALRKKDKKRQNAESTKILINSSSDCIVCGKKIAVSAFARYPDGTLAHFYCHNEKQKPTGSAIL